MEEYIKHENLRRIMNEMACEDGLTDENFETLFSEIGHSTLIMAGDLYAERAFMFQVEFDNKDYGLLFTDMDEFRKAIDPGRFKASNNLFGVYKLILPEFNLDGYIINIESEALILSREMIDLIDYSPLKQIRDDEPYTPRQLKQLKDSANNESLEAFLENPKNIGRYEELFEEMSKSTMFTLMLSDSDLSDSAHDGILETLNDGPVGFMHIAQLGGTYATMYTSEAKMANVETQFNKFSQIVNPAQLIHFILNEDMDGLIINPNSDNVLLTRDVLMEYSSLIQKTCNNPKLDKALFNMFIIEEEV